MSDVAIREARADDLPALRDIYNHYVVHTPATFDVEPKTLAERERWFAQFGHAGRYRCFVGIVGTKPVGWASSARFKEKPAYETTVEASIYMAPNFTGRGLGRRLYETLLEALAGEDIHRIFAGITVPNDASVALHERMGFKLVGTYAEVGRKFGRYWDTALFMKGP